MTLWSICFKYLPKTPVGKIDDIAYTFALALSHQNFIWEISKEKLTLRKEYNACYVRVSSTKNPMGKMDDMTWPCIDIASLKTLYEKPQRKNSKKEKSAIWCLQQVTIQRDSPPDTCKYQIKFVPTYSTHKKWWVW